MGTLTATGVLTASAGASIGAVATSGGACPNKGMIGSDTGGTGKLLYCNSSFVWAFVGSSGVSWAASALGLPAAIWPDFILCYVNAEYVSLPLNSKWDAGTVQYYAGSFVIDFVTGSGAFSSGSAGDCDGQSIQSLTNAARTYWMQGSTSHP